MTMLRDGLADAGRGSGTDDQVTAQDISELLAAAIVPLGGREVLQARACPSSEVPRRARSRGLRNYSLGV